MSKEAPSQGDSGHSYLLGLIPGPQTMDSNWDVDGPSAIRRMEPRSLLAWMADAHRPQPIMVDTVESVDDDA
jgi:hypothetical protein